MGQCLCTFCILPLCCVGRSAAPAFGRARSWRGGVLTTVGAAAFTILSIQCGGIDFFGGGGNSCWSEGNATGEVWGLAAAAGLGVGVPALVYGVWARRVVTLEVDSNV